MKIFPELLKKIAGTCRIVATILIKRQTSYCIPENYFLQMALRVEFGWLRSGERRGHIVAVRSLLCIIVDTERPEAD
jgi:hypothetical protein